MKINTSIHINKGWSAIEVLGVLAIISLASVYGSTMMSDYMDEVEWDVTALHATSVNEAAKTYISDNTDDILSKTTATNAIIITTNTLLDKGYLQKGFSEVNPFGQKYSVAVKRNPLSTNKLEAYTVTTEGSPLSFKGMRYISKKIIGMGGYVYPANVANGASGGWQANLSEFGLAVPEGYLAISLSSEVLGTANQESDRLYRFKVNGRPDLNAMHADIDMGKNSLNNANAVNAKTATVENDIKSNNGWLITQNEKGWLNSTHGGGLTMTDDHWVRSVNNKGIYTGGQLRGGTIHAESRLATDEFLQLNKIMVPGQSCEAGILTRDAEGAPLFCQKGILTSIGGGGMSRAGVNNLDIVSNGSYKVLLVTVSSLFNAADGSHTGSANFNVYVDGVLVGVVGTRVRVDKRGSKGHYWGYQSFGVTQKQIAVNVKSNSRVTVMLAGSSYHNTSDVRIDLTS
jgi:hypothetical protein